MLCKSSVRKPTLSLFELLPPLKHSKQDESGSSSQPGPGSRRPGSAHGLMYASMILIPSNRRLEDLPRPEYANIVRKAYVEYPTDMLHRLQTAGYGKDVGERSPMPRCIRGLGSSVHTGGRVMEAATDVEMSNTLGRASLRHDHCGAVQVATSSNTCVSLSHRGLPPLYEG